MSRGSKIIWRGHAGRCLRIKSGQHVTPKTLTKVVTICRNCRSGFAAKEREKTFANPKTIRIIVPWMASWAELSALDESPWRN